MAEAMDGRDATRLRTRNRRQARAEQDLQWWRNYRAIKSSGSRGLEVRDKGDGSNRYGVIPWDVPLRDQRPTPVVKLEEPEAVHNGYTYRQFPSRRSRELERRRNRQG